MDRLQQNGGTAGMAAGVTLGIAFLLFMTSGLTPEAMNDPARALSVSTTAAWKAAMIFFALTSGLAVLFVVGLSARLRDKAPTRAAALRYIAIIGVAGHALAAMLGWKGAGLLAASIARDQTAAAHAWLALNAVTAGFDGFGNAFTGAGSLLAGWAVLQTGAMPATVGWVSLVTGAIAWLAVLAGGMLPLVNIVANVIFLIWVGSALRRG